MHCPWGDCTAPPGASELPLARAGGCGRALRPRQLGRSCRWRAPGGVDEPYAPGSSGGATGRCPHGGSAPLSTSYAPASAVRLFRPIAFATFPPRCHFT